jgi:5-methylcytosine-specific restriction endonuclease McrA
MAYTRLEWEHTKKHWNGKCAYCGGNRSGKKKNLTKEHVIPESMGGQKIRHNIVPSCGRCNMEKSSYPMEEWFRQQHFFEEKRLQKIFRWIAGGCYSIEIREYKNKKPT